MPQYCHTHCQLKKSELLLAGPDNFTDPPITTSYPRVGCTAHILECPKLGTVAKMLGDVKFWGHFLCHLDRNSAVCQSFFSLRHWASVQSAAGGEDLSLIDNWKLKHIRENPKTFIISKMSRDWRVFQEGQYFSYLLWQCLTTPLLHFGDISGAK